MGIYNCVRLPNLRSRKTCIVGYNHLRRKPKLRFAVSVRNVYMNASLLPRKKEETKLPVSNDSRRHGGTVTNLLPSRLTLKVTRHSERPAFLVFFCGVGMEPIRYLKSA